MVIKEENDAVEDEECSEKKSESEHSEAPKIENHELTESPVEEGMFS